MKSQILLLLIAAVLPSNACAQSSAQGSAQSKPAVSPVAAAQTPDPDAFYHLGPDSLPQEGVPRGEIRGPFTLPSNAYPGTQRTYWVYVPVQYEAATPASLMIYNDGQAFMNPEGDMRAQNVMAPESTWAPAERRWPETIDVTPRVDSQSQRRRRSPPVAHAPAIAISARFREQQREGVLPAR